MKFKKALASVLALGMTITCFAACDMDEDYDYDDDGYEYDDDGETGETGSNGGNSGNSGSVRSVSSMQMSVDQESGSVQITRPESSETAMANDGSWTVFVYLCGTDLESDGGAATGDLEEMCAASANCSRGRRLLRCKMMIIAQMRRSNKA